MRKELSNLKKGFSKSLLQVITSKFSYPLIQVLFLAKKLNYKRLIYKDLNGEIEQDFVGVSKVYEKQLPERIDFALRIAQIKKVRDIGRILESSKSFRVNQTKCSFIKRFKIFFCFGFLFLVNSLKTHPLKVSCVVVS